MCRDCRQQLIEGRSADLAGSRISSRICVRIRYMHIRVEARLKNHTSVPPSSRSPFISFCVFLSLQSCSAHAFFNNDQIHEKQLPSRETKVKKLI